MNPGLLSRIAETLFWMGRYVERADDTARMLDVYVHRLLEDPQRDEEAGCRTLLAILGITAPGDTAVDTDMVVRRLAYDPDNASAIAGALRAARAGGRSVREVISSEVWECLNVSWLSLTGKHRAARRLGPNVYLRYVRERAALFFGLADSTMSRDDAWRFLTLGRYLERVDMTARLLSVHTATPHEPDWSALLSATGADESFVRTHGGIGEPSRVAAFLLLDRMFPRSVVHALASAEGCLAELDPDPVPDPARRPIGRMRTRLEYTDATALLAELPGLLTDLERACVRAGEAVEDRYFRYAAPVAWAQEG